MSFSVDAKYAMARAIQERRKVLKLTQNDVARAVGKSKATISKIESGNHPMDWDVIMAIARELKTSPLVLSWQGERFRLAKNPKLLPAVIAMDELMENLQNDGAFAGMSPELPSPAATNAKARRRKKDFGPPPENGW